VKAGEKAKDEDASASAQSSGMICVFPSEERL
jgi:hypothetical protein